MNAVRQITPVEQMLRNRCQQLLVIGYWTGAEVNRGRAMAQSGSPLLFLVVKRYALCEKTRTILMV